MAEPRPDADGSAPDDGLQGEPDTAQMLLTAYELVTLVRGREGDELEAGAWLTMAALGFEDIDDDPAAADRTARTGVSILHSRGFIARDANDGLVVIGPAGRLAEELRSARFWVRVAARGAAIPRSAMFTQTDGAFVLLDADLADTWRVHLSIAPDLPFAEMVARYPATLASAVANGAEAYEEVSVDVLDDDRRVEVAFARDGDGFRVERLVEDESGVADASGLAGAAEHVSADELEATITAFVADAVAASRAATANDRMR